MSGVDYSIIRQELFLLGDSLEPDDVLFFASNPETELNKFFEWDDKTAAQKYRLHQAKELMRNLLSKDVPHECSIPFVSKVQKYVEIKSLKEAKKNEKICASYPNPSKNVSGYRTDDCIKHALKDAKNGECKLLVWREVEVWHGF
jgi:hypothetical protein